MVRARGAELLALYPEDTGVRRDVTALEDAVSPFERAAAVPVGDRAEVLLAALRSGPPSGAVRAALLRSIAATLRAVGGDASLVDGLPAGHFLLLVGDLDAAESSLRRALAEQPSARLTGFLADVLSARGDHAAAHPLFLRALLDDPHDVRFDALLDAEIAQLPTVAELEIEIEDDPTAWAAPVALVTGVLPTQEALFETKTESPGHDCPSGPRAFVEAMKRAHSPDDDGIAARRAMKRLCPPLFAAYLERRAHQGRGG